MGSDVLGTDTLNTVKLTHDTLKDDKLDSEQLLKNSSYLHILQAGLSAINTQLDPSGQVFIALSAGTRMMLTVFAYRLAKDELLNNRLPAYKAGYVTDFRCQCAPDWY